MIADISRLRKTYSFYRQPPIYMTFNEADIDEDVDPFYGPDNIQWNEVPSGPIDGSNQVFYLQYTPVPPTSLILSWNGVIQHQGEGLDYLLIENKIIFLDDFYPQFGDNLLATYPH